jgi:lysophospholipase L1-like esterase
MRLISFGDSITAGIDATLGYPFLLASDKAAMLKVFAVSGAMAADQYAQINSYAPRYGDEITYMIGANDERIYGTDANKLANFKGILAAEAYYLASVTQNANAWAKTGIWGNNVPNTLGVSSHTAGSTLTANFTGDLLTFGYVIQDGQSGTFNVTVDGVSKGNFNNFGAANVATQNGRGYGPMLGRITGCGPGSHTVVFTTLNSGYVYLDWVGTGAGPNSQKLFLSSISKMTAAGYASLGGSDANVATYNAAISALVTQMQADGLLNVAFVDAGPNIDVTSDLISDGFHPNQQGQTNLAAAFIPVI